MKIYLLAALLPLCSCLATAGDLQRITDKVDQLDLVLNDPVATPEDVKDAVADVKAEAHAVKEEVDARQAAMEDLAKRAGLSVAEVSGIAGLLVTVGVAGLNAWRNGTRKKDLVVAKEETKAETKAEVRAGV